MASKPTYKELGQRIKELEKEAVEDKHAEKTFPASEEEWRSLVENAPNMFLVVDRDGIIKYVNHTASGIEVERVVGTSTYDYALPEYHKVMKESIKHVLQTGQVYRYETKGGSPGGDLAWYLTQVGPIKNEGQVVAVSLIATDITERKRIEEALLKVHDELEDRVKERTTQLEEVNSALRVLLKQRDTDRTELEGKVMLNVKELVVPYAEKLRKHLTDAKQIAYLNILESNLNEIISPFAHKLSSKYSSLTPTEIQTAQLIKDGRTTKEIAELLNVSTRTIESHRQNIRMKMGLHARRANLRSHLLAM